MPQNAPYLPEIHVIGDSHTLFWAGKDGLNKNTPPPPHIYKNFIVHHFGPCLAYSINKYGSRSKGREQFDDLLATFKERYKKPTIMTCLGEIDIRVHIFKEGGGFLNRLNAALNNYLDFIDLYSDRVNFMIYGPICAQKDAWRANPQYPRSGTETERNIATLIFNHLLAKAAKQRDLFFFTLFDDLIDNNFSSDADCIADQCHLTNRIYASGIEKFITEFNKFNALFPCKYL